MNSIFDYMNSIDKKTKAPLAYRMRPNNIDEYVGQEHLLGEGMPLKVMIDNDKITSIILYGDSGVGKTSLAEIIAKTTKSEFIRLNASNSSKADMVKVIDKAKNLQSLYSKNTILFIDEIHRFNKAQQDYLLPYVEDGTVKLIGATTENPYFEVNSALLSRSFIFSLKRIGEKDSEKLISNAIEFIKINDKININIELDAVNAIVRLANGDARRLLQLLELAVTIADKQNNNVNVILKNVLDCIQLSHINYDANGDKHYDTISAFIKSLRGSDPDAALYYLAIMLNAGEDIKFISRRMMISASEDVGNADPMALVVATNAALAVERVGMPEAKIILAQACTYIASAPKSNSSYVGIFDALEEVNKREYSIPTYLRDGHYSGANELGNAIGYKYPHDYVGNYVKQDYLPKELVGKKFYSPTNNGYESNIKSYLDRIRNEK